MAVPHVSQEDIRALAHPTLRHRVLLSYKAEAEGVTIEDVDRSFAVDRSYLSEVMAIPVSSVESVTPRRDHRRRSIRLP